MNRSLFPTLAALVLFAFAVGGAGCNGSSGSSTGLAFEVSPQTASLINQALAPFTVRVQDGAGTLLTDYVEDLSLSVDPVGALTGAMTATPSGGMATFNLSTTSTRGTITLTVTGPGLSPIVAELVVTGPPDALVWDFPPPSHATAGVIMSFSSVRVVDSEGNRVRADSGSSVTLIVDGAGDLFTDDGTGYLTSGVDVATEEGLAVFSNVVHDTDETITLSATTGALSVDAPADTTVEARLAPGDPVERVSIRTDTAPVAEGNNESVESVMSADGRFVAFESFAILVGNDTNNERDLYAHDRLTDTTFLASAVDGTTTPGNGTDPLGACYPAVSADGRWIAYNSRQSDLVSDDTNGRADMFLRDWRENATTLVSRNEGGKPANGLSDWPVFSADGRYLAYLTLASDLVESDTNGSYDVVVYDQARGEHRLATIASDGTQGAGFALTQPIPGISADGRWVAYPIGYDNLISGDTNGEVDVFVHGLESGETVRVSVASDGTQANGDSFWVVLSGTGRYVAFSSMASNLVAGDTNGAEDVFVHDRDTDENGIFDEPGEIATIRVSVDSSGTEGNNRSTEPGISADGRFVVFESRASNLIASDTNGADDIFVHDRDPDEDGIFDEPGEVGTYRVAAGGNGEHARLPWISADGRYISLDSDATNLVGDDTNGELDIYVAPNPNFMP